MKEFFSNMIKPFFTRRRILLIVSFLVVAWWALVNFNHDNRTYAFFIIAFFLISFLLPKPSFMLVVASVIAYILLSSVAIPALSQVRKTIMEASEHPKAPITNLMTPHTGLDVLTSEVQQMLRLVESNKEVTTYRLSPGLSEDYHVVQRITESAWPVRPVESSNYVLVEIVEIPEYATCTVMDETGEVALVNCP